MADTGLQTPTLSTLIDRISSQLNAQLPGQDSRVRRSVLWVLARVWAGVAFLLYGFAVQIANQILPDSANLTFLARHGAIWNVPQKLAQAAAGTYTFAGAPGSVISVGALVVRTDGVQFRTTAGGTFSGSTLALAIEAVAVGAAGNCTAGTLGTLVSPIAGVQVGGTFGTVAGGTDDEPADLWRQRIVERIRLVTQGGSAGDYVVWAKATVGVTVSQVFPLPHTPNAGDVAVYFLVEGSGAARIPSGPQVALVQAQIDAFRSINDTATARAPVDHAVPLTITGLTPNTPEMKAAVTASVVAMFDANAVLAGTIANALLQVAIGDTPGILTFVLTDVGGGGPDADVVAPAGAVARLDSITWA